MRTVLAVLLIASPALAQERVANNNTYQEFPRWKPLVNALNRKDSGGARLQPSRVALAQDPKNVLHMAAAVPNAVFGIAGAGEQIAWLSDEWLTRRGNGWSEPFRVSDNVAGVAVHDPDIAALPDGSVYVFWVQDRQVAASTLEEIYFRKRNPDGSWNAITATGAATLPAGVETFAHVRTAVRGSTIHLVFTRTLVAGVTLEYEADPTAAWAPEIVSNSLVTLSTPKGTNIAVSALGVTHVVYEDFPTAGGIVARYRTRPSGGGWSAATDIKVSGYSPDVSIGSTETPAICHIDGGTTNRKVFVRQGIGGADEHIGNQFQAILAFDRARVVVDSRNRANVIWRYNRIKVLPAEPISLEEEAAATATPTPIAIRDGIGYAVKVGAAWTRQEGIQELDRGDLGVNPWKLEGIDLVINPFDGVSWCDRLKGLVSGMVEPNLGDQDGYGSFGMGPGAQAQAATGNLRFSLPLFSSSGVGFATQFVLHRDSLGADWGTLSNGWHHNYHTFVVDSATGYNTTQDTIALVFGDGRRVFFRYKSTYGYHVADGEFGNFSKLERLTEASSTNWVNSRYRLTTKFGVIYEFGSDGRLELAADTNSNTMTFHYAGDPGYPPAADQPEGALVEIEDSLKDLIATQPGRKTKLRYNADKQLASVQDPKAASANYLLAYDSSKRLASVTFTGAANIVWSFGYTGGHLTLVRTPRGTLGSYGTTYAYFPDHRLQSATDPASLVIVDDTMDAAPVLDSPVRSLSYVDPAAPFTVPNTNPPGLNNVPKAVFTDRRGRTTTIEYQQRRALVDNLTDALNESLIRHFDGTFRNLTRFIDKRGFETRYTYFATATPAHVLDNLKDIERPKDAFSFLPKIEYTYTADGLNRVATVKDSRGATTTYGYTVEGNLNLITYPPTTLATGAIENASESFTYTTRGRQQTWTDAEGNVTTYVYEDDANTGLMTRKQDPGQALVDARRWEHDILGNLVKETAPPNNLSGGVTEYVLDGLYRVDIARDPLLFFVDYDYDENSNVIQIQNKRGFLTNHAYDARDLRTSTTVPAGTSSATYDREEQTRRDTNRRGFTTKTLYDELGRTKEVRRPGAGLVGGGGPEMVMQYLYDENGNQTQAIAVPGRVTVTAFDARNNPVLVTHPITTLTDEMFYDENDNQVAVNRREGTTFRSGTGRIFDERNRVRRTVQLDAAHVPPNPFTGPATNVLFDKNSNRAQVWSPNGAPPAIAHSMTYLYNSRRLVHQILNGLGQVHREFEYYEDNSLKVTRVQKPLVGGLIQSQKIEYTVRGEVRDTFDALNKVWNRVYDENGNLIQTTDPLGKQVDYVFDSSDRLQTMTQYAASLNIVTSYGYDPNHNRTSLTVFNPATGLNDATYLFFFDQADRLEKQQSPVASHTWVYTFNLWGELETSLDPNGKLITCAYDLLGRLSTKLHGAPFNVTVSHQYYGATSLLTQLASTDGKTLDMAYDVILRKIGESWMVNAIPYKSVSYTHHPDGQVMTMIDPEGAFFEYVLDANDRLESIKRDTLTYVSFLFDAGSRRTEALLLNGAHIFYEYTDRDEVMRVRTTDSTLVNLASYFYQYNDRGDVIEQRREHLGEIITYGPDDAGRLTSEISTGGTGVITVPPRNLSWQWDNAHNRTQQVSGPIVTSYNYDSENRLTDETSTGQPTVFYGYDPIGNRLTKTDPTTTETYGYDYEYRMSSFVKTVGGPITVNLTFQYTPDGRRLERHDVLANTSEWYMYSGGHCVTDYTQLGAGLLTHQTSYVNFPQGGCKFARITAVGGAKHYYVTDAEKTITHLLDAAQAIVNSEATDAWGVVVASNVTVQDRYGYRHQEEDHATGLNLAGCHYYQPSIGRGTGFCGMDSAVGSTGNACATDGFSSCDGGCPLDGARPCTGATLANRAQDKPKAKCCCCVEDLKLDESEGAHGRGKHPEVEEEKAKEDAAKGPPFPPMEFARAYFFSILFKLGYKELTDDGETEGNCSFVWAERQIRKKDAEYPDWTTRRSGDAPDPKKRNRTFSQWFEKTKAPLCPGTVEGKFRDAPGEYTTEKGDPFLNVYSQTQIAVTIRSTPGCKCTGKPELTVYLTVTVATTGEGLWSDKTGVVKGDGNGWNAPTK